VRHESSFPVPGGFIRVVTESQFVPESSVPATAPIPAVTGETGRTDPAAGADRLDPLRDLARGLEKATPNQTRKIFAEMHRIGEDLATAYLKGHYGTSNPSELAKKTASEAIRWLVSQPPKKG